MKKIFELFDDTKSDDKSNNRKRKIIKDVVKQATDKHKLSNKKDVFDPDPDLTDSQAVK